MRECVQQRGSVLVFALILLSFTTFAALSVIGATMINQQTTRVVDHSSVAFQAADTGTERVLYVFRTVFRDARYRDPDAVVRLQSFPDATCSGGTITLRTVGIDQARVTVSFFKESGTNIVPVTRCDEDVMTIRAARANGYYKSAVRAINFTVRVPTENVAQGLVAHWPFDGTMDDTEGHAITNHGARVVSYGTAPTGGAALLLDGNDYLAINAHGDFDFSRTESYTIAFWARFAGTSGRQTVLDKVDGYDFVSDGQRVRYQGLLASGFTLRRDQWYHIALVQDGAANTRALYVNGVQYGDAAALSADTRKDVLIGAQSLGGMIGRYFTGYIDDLRFYGRALTPGEILILCTNDFDGNAPVASVQCGTQ